MIKSILAFLASITHLTFTYATCPANGETPQDCPWAEITRATEGLHPVSYAKKIRSIMNEHAPGFLNQLKHDQKINGLLEMWGVSKNVDASDNTSTIVPHNILQLLANELEHKPFDSSFKTGNAGLNHTYGYLFSNLKTPFGFKRARYVKSEIEKGFGLTPGMFGGIPQDGSLLSNFTFFVGSIALQSHPFAPNLAPKELASFDYSQIKFTRVVETVTTSSVKLKITSDYVPFTHIPAGATKDTNVALFIYTIDEGNGPKLITAFPVNTKFLQDLAVSQLFGEQVKDIKVKWNGWLKSGAPTIYSGSRKVMEMP